MTRLFEYYKQTIITELISKFDYKSVMEVPKINKIVLNMGLGEASTDKKIVESAIKELEKIAGQRPVITKARKSIAAFKIRENYPVGCMVTLRGKKMYEFLDRLVSIAIPRIRDFRGLQGKGFDGRGNFNMGIKEQIIFPEIDYDKIDQVRGLQVVIVTDADENQPAFRLLELLGMPFKKEEK